MRDTLDKQDPEHPEGKNEQLAQQDVDPAQAEWFCPPNYDKAVELGRYVIEASVTYIREARSKLDWAIKRYLEWTQEQRSTLRKKSARISPPGLPFSNNLLLFRRKDGYLDLAWATCINGSGRHHYRRVTATREGAHMASLLSGAHPNEKEFLRQMELQARRFRHVDRVLRDASHAIEALRIDYGTLDGETKPRGRTTRPAHSALQPVDLPDLEDLLSDGLDDIDVT